MTTRHRSRATTLRTSASSASIASSMTIIRAPLDLDSRLASRMRAILTERMFDRQGNRGDVV